MEITYHVNIALILILNLNLNGERLNELILAIIYNGVCACYLACESQIIRMKSVMVSAWTCDSLSWFQSTIVLHRKTMNSLIVQCGFNVVRNLRIHGSGNVQD